MPAICFTMRLRHGPMKGGRHDAKHCTGNRLRMRSPHPDRLRGGRSRQRIAVLPDRSPVLLRDRPGRGRMFVRRQIRTAESGVIVDAPAENARPSGSRLPEATYDKGGIPAARFIDAPPPRASGALRFLTVIQSGDSPARQPRVQRCGDAAIRFYNGKKCGFVWAVQ